MSRDDFTPDDLEASLRDVLAHQAESVDTPRLPFRGASDGVAAVELVDEVAERRRFSRPRAFATGAGILATAAAVALFIASITPSTTHRPQSPSETRVLAALNATTGKGSFVATYKIVEHRSPNLQSTPSCGVLTGPPPSVGERIVAPAVPPTCVYARSVAPEIDGTSTVGVDPVSIESTSRIAGIAGDITVHADDTNVTDSNGVGADRTTTSYKLTDFLQAANQTLGAREGSVSIMALASPTGYLTLAGDAARNAKPVGHTKVGGVNSVAVALYESTLTPTERAQVPGTSAEEARAIHAALDALSNEGYTGTTMRIGVGFDGLVHSMTSIAKFADGGNVTLTATFSNFGCEAAASLRHQSVASACALASTTTTTTSTSTVPPVRIITPPDTVVVPFATTTVPAAVPTTAPTH